MGNTSAAESDLPEYSEFKPVAAGIAIWFVLLIIGLLMRGDLAADGREWWIWTAFAGVVQGVGGYGYLLLRAARGPSED